MRENLFYYDWFAVLAGVFCLISIKDLLKRQSVLEKVILHDGAICRPWPSNIWRFPVDKLIYVCHIPSTSLVSIKPNTPFVSSIAREDQAPFDLLLGDWRAAENIGVTYC